MNSISFTAYGPRSSSRGLWVLGMLGLFSTAGLLGGTARASDAAASAKTEIIFDHPENFKDIKYGYNSSEKAEKAQLDMLRDAIVDSAVRYLPDGCKLTMVFTDIDLAGEFEPWRGGGASDIRIIKDIYPPGYKFTWKVTDAAGRIVQEGKENLRDLDFQMKGSRVDNSEMLNYDKAELKDWVRSHLRDLKKTMATR